MVQPEQLDHLHLVYHFTIPLMAILPKGQKLDKLGSHNCLKPSFTNICGLHSNLIKYESFLESNCPLLTFLLSLRQTCMTGNFSVWSYLPLTCKDSITHITHMHVLQSYLPLTCKDSITHITHMHGLAVYVKKRLSFAQNLPLKNSQDSYSYF